MTLLNQAAVLSRKLFKKGGALEYMTWEYLLLRCGEIFLKGKNQPYFVRFLKGNIHKIAKGTKVKEFRGRFIMEFFSEHRRLRNVFGLVSYSPAIKIEKEMEVIKEKAVELLQGKEGTFKILPKRSDKRFPLTSPEINVELGRHIERRLPLKFSGEDPDHSLGIEINQDGAYLFLEVVPCFGGLPTGVEGQVLVLVEDEASLLAGLLLMKRGCYILPVAFKNQNLSLLQDFSPVKLELQIFSDMKEIDKYAQQKNVTVMVSGQHFNNLKKIDTNLAVFKPLISYNKETIALELEKFKSE